MATIFPGGLDLFQNPTSSTVLDSENTLKHSVQHQNLNDGLAAVQSHIGVSGSTVSGTINHRLDLLTNDVNNISSNQSTNLNKILFLVNNGPFEGYGNNQLFKEINYSSYLPSVITWYLDNTKTQKIFEIQYLDRNSLRQAQRVLYLLYNSGGVNIETQAEDIITYNGFNELSRTRTVI